jgi:hypothetical protein
MLPGKGAEIPSLGSSTALLLHVHMDVLKSLGFSGTQKPLSDLSGIRVIYEIVFKVIFNPFVAVGAAYTAIQAYYALMPNRQGTPEV